MNDFKNVSVAKLANVYFDGSVTSRTITFHDGSVKTLGIMLPGEYTFNTGKKEIMDIQQGEVDVLLPDSNSWVNISAGDSFTVKAKSSFQIRVKKLTDYCCSFID